MSSGDVKTEFGAAVRSKRCELGISQEELADRADLHRTYISDVERGARNPSLESIEKLARALELTVSALFQYTHSENCAAQHVEILLVEDDKNDLELTLRAFRNARFTNVMHVARDGAEALDFIFAKGPYESRRNQPLPGLILLDLNLPKINGLEVLRLLKADERRRSIPVIVLTVSSQDRDIAECRRLGADRYIVKPVGFQNFSEATPNLLLEWALMKPTGGDGHESKAR